MSYKILEHATDAMIELEADTLEKAIEIAGNAVVDITLNRKLVENTEEREVSVKGKDLRYLLLNWIEEINYLLITEGFAIKKLKPIISHSEIYKIESKVFGETLDLSKHEFKVEIKAPTFHEMEIREDEKVYMKFLIDL